MVGTKMVVTKDDIVKAMNSLQQMAGVPMDQKGAYWLQRNFKQVEAIYKGIEKKRNKIITAHGEPNDQGIYSIQPTITTVEEGEEKQIPNPKLAEAQKLLEALSAEEVEITIFEININSFKGSMSWGMMDGIHFMLDDESANLETSNIVLLKK